MSDMGETKEHPISAIFSRSDRLRENLCGLRSDVEAIEQTLLGMEPSKDPMEEAKRPRPPLLGDIIFKLDEHINEVEKIQKIISTIKASLINEPQTPTPIE